MAASKWSAEEKAKALELHEKLGPAEAARQTGIPKNTIASWAKRTGVQTVAGANTAEAVEMARLMRAEKREQLRDELLSAALNRVREMDTERPLLSKAGVAVMLDDRPVMVGVEPQGQQQLSAAVKNLVETFRLELGEATSRNEVGKDDLAAFMLGARTAFDVAEQKAEASKQPV